MVAVKDIDNGALGDEALSVAEALRAIRHPDATETAAARALDVAERAGLQAVPVAGSTARFVDADAGLVAQGPASPRLVRAALKMVDGVREAARSGAERVLSERATDAGPQATAQSGTTRSGRSGDMVAAAAEAGREAGRRLVQAAINGARRDRAALGKAAKFVTDGAVVQGLGNAREAAPVFALAGRLAAAGLISSMSIVMAPDKAEAGPWGRYGGGTTFQGNVAPRPVQNFGGYNPGYYPRRHRDSGTGTAIAAGVAGLAVGALVGGALNSNNNYARPYGLQNNYPINNGYPVGSYGGGYGNYGSNYGGGYGGYGQFGGGYAGHSPAVPSNDFIKAAKVLVAAQARSIRAGDVTVDRMLANGIDCARRLGPGANCLVESNGVAMDFSRGQFIATFRGMPVVTETYGRTQVNRPDILRDAFTDALRMKEAQMSGYYGPRY